MSTGPSQPDDAAAPERISHPAFESPMLRQTLITFGIAVAIACFAYFALSKRHAELELSQLADRPVDPRRPIDGSASPVPFPSVQDSDPHNSPRKPYNYEDVNEPPGTETAYFRAQASRAQLGAKQARELISKLRSKLASWHKTYAPLFTNDAGRRIAASESDLELALTALQRERVTDDVAATWLIELEHLAGPLERSTQPEEFLSSPQLDRIERIRQSASTELEHLQTDLLLLDSLLKETAKLDPGPRTLSNIAQRRRLAREKARIAELAKFEDEQFAKGTAELRKAIEERAARNIEIERRKIANE